MDNRFLRILCDTVTAQNEKFMNTLEAHLSRDSSFGGALKIERYHKALERLERGEADLVIVSDSELPDSRYKHRILQEHPLVLVTSKDSLDFETEMLKRFPLLLPQRETRYGTIATEIISSLGLENPIILKRDFYQIARCLETEHCTAILPEYILPEDVDRRSIVPLGSNACIYTIAVWNREYESTELDDFLKNIERIL